MIAICSLFWFLLAVIFALVEIESEGKYGWAQNMPTWYRTRGNLIIRLFVLANAGKPLTGYHTFMFFMPLMVLHSPFVMGVEWTAAKEIMTFALYFGWCPLWDYLWFVLNPAYGWRRFKKENVWWHAKDKWLLRLPLSYFIACGISMLLAVCAARVAQDNKILTNHLMMMGLFLIFTVVTIILSPLYHRWYKHMREYNDGPDRTEAGIFFHD